MFHVQFRLPKVLLTRPGSPDPCAVAVPDRCWQDGLHARYSEAIEQERAESGILRSLVEEGRTVKRGLDSLGFSMVPYEWLKIHDLHPELDVSIPKMTLFFLS